MAAAVSAVACGGTSTPAVTGGDDDGGSGVTPGGGSTATLPPPVSIDAGPATYTSESLMATGKARTYGLALPAGYSSMYKYPLVFVFHGDGGTGAQIRAGFPIEAQANNQAIFVYPDGTNDNDGHSFDQAHDPPDNADVDFFDAMLTSLKGSYSVDPKAIYVTGMSGGGYFVNQLSRWRATAIWGNAPMSGGGPFGNGDADFDKGMLSVNGQVPTLIIHGDADGSVDISEGKKSLAYWRMANACGTGTSAIYTDPCQNQSSCTLPVIWCEVPTLDHSIWSNAPMVIWTFFASLQSTRG